ncbi:LysM peptidoglycan-binding domain-containing protein [Dokdonella ginsengisoli]|uniref:LysM peptidoglycan-binding domain-containing protein n=1 Tax=Dokdonella ginsengisoli TaxID=363846 RepID=A0ABV9QU26_9GAMM
MTLLNSSTVSRHFFDARASFAPRAADADITYTVKAGDSYYGIARDHLVHGGIQNPSQAQIVDYMERIAAANGTRTDDVLLPGDELVLPPLDEPVAQTPPAAPAAGRSEVVDASDGIDVAEGAYVLERNFDAIDTDGNGKLSEQEIDAYAATVDPASAEGQAIVQIRDSRGVDGGLYQEIGYGANSGSYGDGTISAKDIANVLASSPVPPGLDADAQAAFVSNQLNAINRAVEHGYGKGDAADLVEMVLARNAAVLADPQVAGRVDLDAATTSAGFLADKSDNPVALTTLSNLLAAGIDRKHELNLDTDAAGAIGALANVFERYLELEGGKDPAAIAQAAQDFIVDSGLDRIGLSPFTVGVVSGAVIGGGLDRVQAITDDRNRQNDMFRAALTGAAVGFSILSAGAATPAAAVALAGASEFFGVSAGLIDDATADNGPLYTVEGGLRLGFEELDAPANPRDPGDASWVTWSEQDIDAASRGLDAGLNASGYPS